MDELQLIFRLLYVCMYVFASAMKPIRTEENRQTEIQIDKLSLFLIYIYLFIM